MMELLEEDGYGLEFAGFALERRICEMVQPAHVIIAPILIGIDAYEIFDSSAADIRHGLVEVFVMEIVGFALVVYQNTSNAHCLQTVVEQYLAGIEQPFDASIAPPSLSRNMIAEAL